MYVYMKYIEEVHKNKEKKNPLAPKWPGEKATTSYPIIKINTLFRSHTFQ